MPRKAMAHTTKVNEDNWMRPFMPSAWRESKSWLSVSLLQQTQLQWILSQKFSTYRRLSHFIRNRPLPTSCPACDSKIRALFVWSGSCFHCITTSSSTAGLAKALLIHDAHLSTARMSTALRCLFHRSMCWHVSNIASTSPSSTEVLSGSWSSDTRAKAATSKPNMLSMPYLKSLSTFARRPIHVKPWCMISSGTKSFIRMLAITDVSLTLHHIGGKNLTIVSSSGVVLLIRTANSQWLLIVSRWYERLDPVSIASLAGRLYL